MLERVLNSRGQPEFRLIMQSMGMLLWGLPMVERLSFVTVVIALFGFAMTSFAQHSVGRTGSAVASFAGEGCNYTQGIVCSIERTQPETVAKF